MYQEQEVTFHSDAVKLELHRFK